jgi:DNA-binding transcriptional ArsR family regulator
VNGFHAIAEPRRRAILDRPAERESDVGTLVEALRLPQPLVSKHLKVLRDAGVVDVAVVGRRRVYRLAEDPLPEVLAWVAPYARRWELGLDRPAAALDADAPTPQEER